jgi:hypothetical protein
MEQESVGVLACLPVAPPLTAQCWVGRTQEMAVLEAALAASCGGQGQLVFLEGEPGIGKTRMLQELAASALDHAMAVLWGRCYEGEGAPLSGHGSRLYAVICCPVLLRPSRRR